MTAFNTTLANSSNNYFDLGHYIEDIKMAQVAAEMASSTAWRLDTLLVKSSRELLKFIKADLFNQGGFESMSEIINAMDDAEFSEKCFHEIGTHDTSSLESIRTLSALRDSYHEMASRLVSMTSDYTGAPRIHVIPDIEAEFRKDPVLRVNETQQRRLKTSSERMAQALGAPELAEEAYARKLQRKVDNNARIASVLKDQASIVFEMYRQALRSKPDDFECSHFYQLPIEAQRILLDNAGQAALRASDRAADDRNMSDTEFDMIDITAIKAMNDMKKVMSAPRFTNRERTEATV